MIGRLFCLYVKLLLPSIFNSVDFWSNTSCIVIDFELAYKNVNKKLLVLIVENVQDFSFRSPKSYKTTNQAFWYTGDLDEIVWKSGCLDYIELPNTLPSNSRGERFSEGSEKCKNFGTLIEKGIENMDDHGCPKVRDLIDSKTFETIGVCSIFNSWTDAVWNFLVQSFVFDLSFRLCLTFLSTRRMLKVFLFFPDER